MPPVVLNVTADANGNAEAKLSDVAAAYLIQQVTVEATGGTGQCELRLNEGFVCGSTQGWQDSADGDPAVYVARGDQLRVVWSNVGPGVSCTALMLGLQGVGP